MRSVWLFLKLIIGSYDTPNYSNPCIAIHPSAPNFLNLELYSCLHTNYVILNTTIVNELLYML